MMTELLEELEARPWDPDSSPGFDLLSQRQRKFLADLMNNKEGLRRFKYLFANAARGDAFVGVMDEASELFTMTLVAVARTLGKRSDADPLPADPVAWFAGAAENIVKQHLRHYYKQGPRSGEEGDGSSGPREPDNDSPDPVGRYSTTYKYDLQQAADSALDSVTDPENVVVERLAAEHQLRHEVWLRMTPRLRAAAYAKSPNLVQRVFPDEVADLKVLSTRYAGTGAGYKAVHDMHKVAQRQREREKDSLCFG